LLATELESVVLGQLAIRARRVMQQVLLSTVNAVFATTISINTSSNIALASVEAMASVSSRHLHPLLI